MAGRPKWQDDMQAVADATGKVFVIGLRPWKDQSWFANCDGEEVDAGSPQAAVRDLIGLLARKADTAAWQARQAAAEQERKHFAVSQIAQDRG